MVLGIRTSGSSDSLRKEVGNTLNWETSSSKVSQSLRKWSAIVPHILVSLVTAFICWLLFTSSATNSPLGSPKTRLLTCGNTTTEARALGCKFDPLTVAWIPAPCMNHQVTDEFMAEYPWEAFSDETGSELITREQMSEYTAPQYYYTAMREHAVHCLYSMLKFHQGYMGHTGGLYIDSESANYMHTKHCVGVVKRAIDRDPSKLGHLDTRNTVALLTCEVEV